MKHPLISQILENGKIKSMTHGFGIGSTGEAHLAVLDDKKYLLRICPDKKTTKKYWGYYRKFKKYNFLPKLLEIRGRYMLFEFIEGRTAYEKDSPKVIYQVGKICAIINNYKVDKGYKRKKSFAEKLQEIKNKKIISRELLAKVEGEYKQLDKKVKLKNSLDAGDVTNDNFIVNQKGKVYFVDI